jgi:hypothetical protein
LSSLSSQELIRLGLVSDYLAMAPDDAADTKHAKLIQDACLSTSATCCAENPPSTCYTWAQHLFGPSNPEATAKLLAEIDSQRLENMQRIVPLARSDWNLFVEFEARLRQAGRDTDADRYASEILLELPNSRNLPRWDLAEIFAKNGRPFEASRELGLMFNHGWNLKDFPVPHEWAGRIWTKFPPPEFDWSPLPEQLLLGIAQRPGNPAAIVMLILDKLLPTTANPPVVLNLVDAAGNELFDDHHSPPTNDFRHWRCCGVDIYLLNTPPDGNYTLNLERQGQKGNISGTVTVWKNPKSDRQERKDIRFKWTNKEKASIGTLTIGEQ